MHDSIAFERSVYDLCACVRALRGTQWLAGSACLTRAFGTNLGLALCPTGPPLHMYASLPPRYKPVIVCSMYSALADARLYMPMVYCTAFYAFYVLAALTHTARCGEKFMRTVKSAAASCLARKQPVHANAHLRTRGPEYRDNLP